MNLRNCLSFLVLIAASIPLGLNAQTPTPTPATYSVVVETVTTSYEADKPVTPTARFGHDLNSSVEVTFDYTIIGPACVSPRPPNAVERVVLLEDGVEVDAEPPCEDNGDDKHDGLLSYSPSVPGTRILTVVALLGDGTEVRSAGVPVQMFGVSLQTALGDTVTTPYLPFTSRIFLQSNALFADANVKKAECLHRSLPFPLSAGVPYSVGDKVVSDGRVFVVQAINGAHSLPPGAPRRLIGDSDQDEYRINGITFRYAGPRIASEIDYYNIRLSGDPAVQVPDTASPPRGKADLVILNNDQIYQVVTAGRIAEGSKITISADKDAASAIGVIRFTRVGEQLAKSHKYFRGDLVVSNGRIYEVVQGGTTTNSLGQGLTETDGEVQINGSVAFTFIPSKVLREQLPYWRNDLVISNGGVYRAENPGTIRAGALGSGLLSPTTGEKQTIVRFARVKDSSVEVAGNKIVRSGTGEVVIPQYHKYSDINADYAGVPLQQGTVYRTGDVVASNGHLYEVVTGGTMGPVGAGLTKRPTQTLGGLGFKYLRENYKQISTIRPDLLTAGAFYTVGERVVSNGRVYEITGVPTPYVALTPAEVATGLTGTSGDQHLGGFTFRFVAEPFVDVPFPYSSFDYSFPYSLKWSPAETIANHFSWFGRYGYFENTTVVELFTRVTDSKDRTSTSGTVPASVLPPIDARAALATTITSPSNERLVAAGTPVEITAESKDENGVVRLVQSVQLFVDGVPLYAPDVTFPYTTEGPAHWTPTVAGTYILNALAIDDKGNYTISPDVRVNVTDNQPFVRITAPVAGDPLNPFVVAPNTTLHIKGLVSGSGGDPDRVEGVEILSDGNPIGSPTVENGAFNFAFAPTNASDAPINYQITARVIDVNGATASSNTVYIQVTTEASGPPAGARPKITSPLTAKGQENIPFSYTIVATNRPTAYGASGLPAGLKVDIATGVISGTPKVSGKFDVLLTATNSKGTGNATLRLSLVPAGTTVVQFAQATYTATSTDGTITLGVNLFRAAGDTDAFTVAYATSNGTATAGQDYDAESGIVTFAAGQTQQTITINLIAQGAPTAARRFFVTLSNPARGELGTDIATVIVSTPDLTTKVLNISTRGPVKSGQQVMIAGFIIQGSSSKQLVLRGIGPSLTQKGVPSALSDPNLELRDANGAQVAYNDDYTSNSEADRKTLSNTGLTPNDSSEAAIVATVSAGTYTAILRGQTNGVGLVETYDISGTAASRLVNISTRGQVDQGDNGAMIGGFIVGTPGNGPGTGQHVVVRALGPSLQQAGITGTLEDTTLDLYRGSDLILSNDDWMTNSAEDRAALESYGLAPASEREAALITNLDPGSYSAVVRGKDNTTGVALVELYQLQ